MEASKTPGKTLLFALIPLAALLIAAELATRLFIDPPYQPFIIAKSDYLPFTTPHNETCTQTIGDAAYRCEYHFNADGFRVSAESR